MKEKQTTDELLNEMLDSYQVAAADLALQHRILAIPDRPGPWHELLEMLGGWRIAGPAFVFSMVLGISTSLWLGPNEDAGLTQETIWTVAGLDQIQDWNE